MENQQADRFGNGGRLDRGDRVNRGQRLEQARDARQQAAEQRREAAEARQDARMEENDDRVRREGVGARQEIRDGRREAAEDRQQSRQQRREQSRADDAGDQARADQQRDGLLGRRDVDRDQARRLLRDALPVLRQNLPEILDVLGETIDQREMAAAQSSRAWLQVHRELARRTTDSIRQELERDKGGAFDQAFLGYQLVAHLEMLDGIRVLQQHASPEMRKSLDADLAAMEGHLQQARQLMSQLSSGNES